MMNDPLSYDADRRVILDQNGLAVARDVGAADAFRITEALSICADLPSVLRDVVETHIYDVENGEVIDPEDPLLDFAKRAENVTADEPEGTPPAPASDLTLDAILSDMLAYKAEQFDGDDETDLSVSGADLVDAFTQWRIQIKAVMAARPATFAPAPIGLLEIAGDLSAAIEGLDHQVEQMKGMFPDDDGAIRQAQDDGDEARQRLAMFRKGADTGVKVVVTLSGGNITDVDFSGPCPGLEVITVDYDTEGAITNGFGDPDDFEMVNQSAPGQEPDWQSAYVARYTNADGPGVTLAEMRPATAEDLG